MKISVSFKKLVSYVCRIACVDAYKQVGELTLQVCSLSKEVRELQDENDALRRNNADRNRRVNIKRKR